MLCLLPTQNKGKDGKGMERKVVVCVLANVSRHATDLGPRPPPHEFLTIRLRREYLKTMERGLSDCEKTGEGWTLMASYAERADTYAAGAAKVRSYRVDSLKPSGCRDVRSRWFRCAGR